MNRRHFLSSLPAVVAVPADNGPKKFGHLDPDKTAALRGQRIYLRILFNGESVGNRCREADDIAGYVVLLKHRDGQAYIENGNLATERLYGNVVVEQISEEAWKERR